MVRACNRAGTAWRPNNSLAGVPGSSGRSSGGSGTGLTLPLSCAPAGSGADNTTAISNAANRPKLRLVVPLGEVIVVVMSPSDYAFCRPAPSLRRRTTRHRAPDFNDLPGNLQDFCRQVAAAARITAFGVVSSRVDPQLANRKKQ
jgi:hypothetical protein